MSFVGARVSRVLALLFSRQALMIVLFFLASSIDVRVKAQPVELPQGCWQSLDRFKVCGYLNGQTKKIVHLAFGDLRMSPKASLVVDQLNQPDQNQSDQLNGLSTTLHFVRGTFWLNAREPVTVKTLYGSVQLKNAKVLMNVQDRSIEVTNLKGDLIYLPRGSHIALHLPEGMSVQMGRVSQTGVAQTGFPHAAVVPQLLSTWGKLYSQKDLALWQDQVKQFIPEWAAASSEVGPWYRQVVERELASAQADKNLRARQKARVEAENRKLRQLFRRMNFVGVNPDQL